MLMRALHRLLRPKYGKGWVSYKGRKMEVHLADSFAAMMFGLMYWDRLEKGKGMLFVLRRPGREFAGIWMLNVKFPIDIVWIGDDQRVVDIVGNAKPCKSIFKCKMHVPREKAKYVLELNAESARKLGMKTGERIGIKAHPGRN
jgi:hypothetical protein